MTIDSVKVFLKLPKIIPAIENFSALHMQPILYTWLTTAILPTRWPLASKNLISSVTFRCLSAAVSSWQKWFGQKVNLRSRAVAIALQRGLLNPVELGNAEDELMTWFKTIP